MPLGLGLSQWGAVLEIELLITERSRIDFRWLRATELIRYQAASSLNPPLKTVECKLCAVFAAHSSLLEPHRTPPAFRAAAIPTPSSLR